MLQCVSVTDPKPDCLKDAESIPIYLPGACWVLGYMARHDVSLAYQVIAAGAVPLLILCLQEPEMNVRQVAASKCLTFH